MARPPHQFLSHKSNNAAILRSAFRIMDKVSVPALILAKLHYGLGT